MFKRKRNIWVSYLLFSIIVILVVIILFLLYNIINTNSYKIILNGLQEVSIYQGDQYVEEGYLVYDSKDNLIDKEVKIDNKVDINTPGTYKITYTIKEFLKKSKVTRTVIVLDNPLQGVKLSLKGNKDIEIDLNTDYTDEGVTCVNKDKLCINDVKVDTNLKTNKLGSYYYTYKYTIGTKSTEVTRNITVKGEKYSFTLSDTNLTNKDVDIDFTSNINEEEFSYILDPKDTKIETDNTKFVVTENGDYTFKIYQKDNNVIEAKISVTNIDKEKPTGTCKANISSNKTSFKITGNDNTGVEKFVFNNKEYKEDFVINSKVTAGNLTVYDKAGNYEVVSCKYIYEAIKPTETVSTKYEGSTFKFYVTNVSGGKLTYVWMEDPYTQVKAGLGGNPNGLRTTSTILKSEIDNNNYSSKAMVAVNGSGFTSSQFDSYFKNYDSKWYNTAVIPYLLNNGKVIRDNTTNVPDQGRHFLTYGITKDNTLKVYDFARGKNLSSNAELAKKIKDEDKVLYTFGFIPQLVKDGKINDSGTDSAVRNSMCQVDKNNFLLFSSSGNATYKQQATLFVNHGCQTAVSLDGGGSRNLYYKLPNASPQGIYVTSRAVADIVYFVEK